MSKRDTIIIAVLVNAAILLILFATAMRSDKKKEDSATPLVKEESVTHQDALASNASVDENADDAAIDILGDEETEVPSEASNKAGEAAPQVIGAPQSTAVKSTNAPQSPAKALATQTAAPTDAKAASNVAVKSKAIAAQTTAKTDEPLLVTVKKGDALEKIARTNQSSVAAIMRANNLASTQLKVGQVLKVPAAEKTEATLAPQIAVKEATKPQMVSTSQQVTKSVAVQAVKPQTATNSENYYTVKEGDSAWMIASRHGVKLEELLRLNGMDNEKAKHLHPGDKLRIR